MGWMVAVGVLSWMLGLAMMSDYYEKKIKSGMTPWVTKSGKIEWKEKE
jgi:hypothetical protein